MANQAFYIIFTWLSFFFFLKDFLCVYISHCRNAGLSRCSNPVTPNGLCTWVSEQFVEKRIINVGFIRSSNPFPFHNFWKDRLFLFFLCMLKIQARFLSPLPMRSCRVLKTEPLHCRCVPVTEGTAVSGVFSLIGLYFLKAWYLTLFIWSISNSYRAEGGMWWEVECHEVGYVGFLTKLCIWVFGSKCGFL